MGRIYHRTPQKVNTFYHKLNIEELLGKAIPVWMPFTWQ